MKEEQRKFWDNLQVNYDEYDEYNDYENDDYDYEDYENDDYENAVELNKKILHDFQNDILTRLSDFECFKELRNSLNNEDYLVLENYAETIFTYLNKSPKDLDNEYEHQNNGIHIIFDNYMYKGIGKYGIETLDSDKYGKYVADMYDMLAEFMIRREIGEKIENFIYENREIDYSELHDTVKRLTDNVPKNKLYNFDEVIKDLESYNVGRRLIIEINDSIDVYKKDKEMIVNSIKDEFHYLSYVYSKTNDNKDTTCELSGFKARYENKTYYVPDTKEKLLLLLDDENISLEDINTSLITDMSYAFLNTDRKNFDGIEKWDMSSVKEAKFMFANDTYDEFEPMLHFKFENKNFNHDISNWNLSSLEDASNMFAGCSNFNQPIDLYLPNCETLRGAFGQCFELNSPINIVAPKCEDMAWMFANNHSLNQKPIINKADRVVYNPPFAKLKDMESMFEGCENLKQDFKDWKISKSVIINNMFEGTKVSEEKLPKLTGFDFKEITDEEIKKNLDDTSMKSGIINQLSDLMLVDDVKSINNYDKTKSEGLKKLAIYFETLIYATSNEETQKMNKDKILYKQEHSKLSKEDISNINFAIAIQTGNSTLINFNNKDEKIENLLVKAYIEDNNKDNFSKEFLSKIIEDRYVVDNINDFCNDLLAKNKEINFDALLYSAQLNSEHRINMIEKNYNILNKNYFEPIKNIKEFVDVCDIIKKYEDEPLTSVIKSAETQKQGVPFIKEVVDKLYNVHETFMQTYNETKQENSIKELKNVVKSHKDYINVINADVTTIPYNYFKNDKDDLFKSKELKIISDRIERIGKLHNLKLKDTNMEDVKEEKIEKHVSKNKKLK